ncbi:MAG: FAD-dependent oxidoreductase [Candidatus Acidiferrales bacterium]
MPFQLLEARASTERTVSVAASSEALMRRNKLERHEMADGKSGAEKLPRRAFLKGGASLGAASLLGWFESRAGQGRGASGMKPHVAVVGAGAFGGWAALHLLRRGARVTLLDAWGPGNSRASSGGETRVIRATYGADKIYTQMSARALLLWQEHEAKWQRHFFHRTGVLWMAGKDDAFLKDSLPHLREAGRETQALDPAQAARRFPQINFEGVEWALLEKDAGYLTARLACQAVLEGFVAEGGHYRPLSAEPEDFSGGKLRRLRQSNDTTLEADLFVFACGPWLPKLFPDVLGPLIRSTRQEVFFFGTPAGDNRFSEESVPVWGDVGEPFMYGIPGNVHRGFKIADDTRGPAFDPTSGERAASAEGLEAARRYLGFRFPALAGAPLLEARVCQYEETPDHHFILDRHPQAANLWLLGGGSGHGFKHGPALGELAAEIVLEKKAPEPLFQLGRFTS